MITFGDKRKTKVGRGWGRMKWLTAGGTKTRQLKEEKSFRAPKMPEVAKRWQFMAPETADN